MGFFSRKKKITINCLHPKEEHRGYLAEILQELSPDLNAWSSPPYIIKSADGEIEVALSHTVIARYSEQNPNEYRYEVLGEKELGNGNFGFVKEILATIAIDKDLPKDVTVKQHKKRVAKIQIIDARPANDESVTLDIDNEETLSRKVKYLHCKQKSMHQKGDKKIATLVMGKIPGQQLKSYELGNYFACKSLTVFDRVNLTVALLKAYKNQIQQNEIVHRDIKPENIMVCKKDGFFTVKFLDFGLGFEYTNPNGNEFTAGTKEYISPESGCPDYINDKLDIHSFGSMIAQLWNAQLCAEFKDLEYYDVIDRKRHEDYVPEWKDIFKGMKLDTNLELDIRQLINSMTKRDPAARSTLDKAIENAEKIRCKYIRLNHHSKPVADNIDKLFFIAAEVSEQLSRVDKMDKAGIALYKQKLLAAFKRFPDSPDFNTTFSLLADLNIPAAHCKSRESIKAYVETRVQNVEASYDRMEKLLSLEGGLSAPLAYLESSTWPDTCTAKLGKERLVKTLKDIQTDTIRKKLESKSRFAVNLENMDAVSDSFERVVKKYNTVTNQILFGLKNHQSTDPVIRFTNSIRLAMLQYVNDTTNEKNIFKRIRSYSPRREKEMRKLLDELNRVDRLDSGVATNSLERIKLGIEIQMKNMETGFFGRSLLRDYVISAVDKFKLHAALPVAAAP